jgi:glutamate carboxypeptidase
MNETDRALVAYVAQREGEWVALLRDLVNLDSGTLDKSDVDRVGRLLADQVAALGFAVQRVPQERYGDHYVARKPGRGDRRLLLLGHFDTVWPRGTAAARPFTISGDRATGPGVYDMKGGLTVMIAALSALRAVGAPAWSDVTLTLVLNSDEELGSPTARPLIEAEAQQADAACVLEPGRPGGEYVLARKGTGLFTLAVRGRAAHSGAQPELGRSAIEELARKIILLHAITDFEIGTTVNVGVIRGGERPNVVAAYAECEFDLRARTPEEAERALRRIEEIAALQFVPDTRTELRGGMRFDPLPLSPRNEALFGCVQEAGRALGLELRAIATGGSSDGNTAGQFTPVVDGMGPIGDGAHSEHEFVVLPSIVQRAQVLALFLAAWPECAQRLRSVRPGKEA